MSGYRYSSYALAQAQKERLRVLDAIRRQDDEAAELRAAIAEALDGASEGLKSTFAGEVGRAGEWLAGATLTEVDPQAATNVAQAAEVARRQTLDAGRTAHLELATALTQKADEMGQRLGRVLAETQGDYLAGRGLLHRWFPNEATAFDQSLNEAKELLASGHYGELAPLLDGVSTDCRDVTTRAGELEEKHQQRLYLLDALLQTCRKLGFRILEEPAQDALGPSTDPLKVRVDTLDRGKIDFTLSLDKIESDSNMVDSYCPREFGLLSQRLQEHFGVATKFTVTDEAAAPIGRARDEKDLPGLSSRGL